MKLIPKSRLILSGWVLSLLLSLVPQTTTASANFSYNTDVTYRVEADGSNHVTESYEVVNNTARQYLTEIKLFIPTQTLKGLKVSYDDGANIPASTSTKATARGDLKYDYQEVSINFPRQIYGQGRRWKFLLRYQAEGLVETKGSSHTVYVPSIDPGEGGDSYNVTVDVPQEFGNPHFAGAKSASGGVSDGRQFYNFSKADLVASSLALAFGDSTIYRLNFNYPLHNSGPIPRLMTVALPPDLASQKVYQQSLNPRPNSTRLDADGNVLADYWVGANQTLTVKTDVDTEVKYLEYDLAASKYKKDIPADLIAHYTAPTHFWQTSGAVGQAARKLSDDKAPVVANVKAIYQFVIDKLSYNQDKVKFNIRQGASAALANPSNAVCLEYADLLIAMLRSQGIPARMPIGYAYTGSLKATSGVADSLHAWVEAYVPGIGWMSLDPTWGEKFDQFGKSDLDHAAFAIWGEQDSAPGAVMIGNNDTNYQYEASNLSFISKIIPVPAVETVTVTRFSLLPFVSLDRVKVKARPQVVTDHNSIKVGRQTLPVGSLAPSQQLVLNHFVFGQDWNRSAEAKLERTENGRVIVLAATRIKADGRVMWLILLILIVAGGWLVVRSRRPSAI